MFNKKQPPKILLKNKGSHILLQTMVDLCAKDCDKPLAEFAFKMMCIEAFLKKTPGEPWDSIRAMPELRSRLPPECL